MKRKDNIFASTAVQSVERNTFDLSHSHKTTGDMGELLPVVCQECIPGDVWDGDMLSMVRFLPLLAPVMERCKVRTEWFFVPNRILFDKWEDFITGVGDPVEWPYFQVGVGGNTDLKIGSIAQYLGIPEGDYSANPIDVNLLPIIAYYKIWDDWYRASTIQVASLENVTVVPGFNDLFEYANEKPLRRAWEHDYFTSALLTAQQGTPVDIPLVFQDDILVEFKPDAQGAMIVVNPDTGAPLAANTGTLEGRAGPAPFGQSLHAGTNPAAIDPNGMYTVDIQAEAASLNDLREAFALQAFLERTIRGGERYTEQIWSHFRVRSSDARLQRPELVSASVGHVNFSEVLATATNTDADTVVGEMFGHGISASGTKNWSYKCEEHGWMICMLSVVPETAYQGGIAPKFTERKDRFDYAWPTFAHLGERPIRRKELVANDYNAPTDLDAVFGYIPQYAEYKYAPSRVSGDMVGNLNFWHCGRIFSALAPPALNSAFIQCDPSKRIFSNISGEDDSLVIWVMVKLHVSRLLPRYAVPQLVG